MPRRIESHHLVVGFGDILVTSGCRFMCTDNDFLTVWVWPCQMFNVVASVSLLHSVKETRFSIFGLLFTQYSSNVQIQSRLVEFRVSNPFLLQLWLHLLVYIACLSSGPICLSTLLASAVSICLSTFSRATISSVTFCSLSGFNFFSRFSCGLDPGTLSYYNAIIYGVL